MIRNPLLYRALFAAAVLTALASGGGCDNRDRLNFRDRGRPVPAFESDSAYRFVRQQVAFGPRNPGSEGHRRTQAWLTDKLTEYAGQRGVYVQRFVEEGYEGDTLRLANIIAAFNPSAPDRIMLCAHWDTRPRAEEDPENPSGPIPGADDGGSGVAVLLELARLFRQQPPPIGVDIVLFDGEDYGKTGDMGNYFLGSRHWSENQPVPDYRPRFGILLDMVGGRDAQFPKEQNSYRMAPSLVNEVWSIAAEKGFSDIFIDRPGSAISDDHVVINRILGIPTIDIIRHRPPDTGDASGGSVRFAPYWHTRQDDMGIISRTSLGAVGAVLAELIYNRI